MSKYGSFATFASHFSLFLGAIAEQLQVPFDASVDPTDARNGQNLRRRNRRPAAHWHSSGKPAVEAGQVHSC